MNSQSEEKGPPPLHEWAIPHLQSIAEKCGTRIGNDLELVQAEFRGALGMLKCAIPKGHVDLRDAVRDFALQLDMIDDEMVLKVADHILEEKERADRKQAAAAQ